MALNILCYLFHGIFTVFNIFGWIFPKTRRLNLITLSLTFISWFGLGYFYGWGYCPLTQWHWEIKHRLSQGPLPDSYIKHIVDSVTGLDVNADLVDKVTVATFFISLIFSIILNFKKNKV